MSVQDIIFAASGGASSPTSIEYAVGVYDLPITANWSALVYTGDKTVIVGDNKFITITDPADQSTMVYGDLPQARRSDLMLSSRLSYQLNTVIIACGNKFAYCSAPYATWGLTSLDYVDVYPYDVTPYPNSSSQFYLLYNATANNFRLRKIFNLTTHKISNDISSTYSAIKSLTVEGSLSTLLPKFNKYTKQLVQTTPTNSYAYGKLNGLNKYVYIGNDGFFYESTDGKNYLKNTATIIPAGTYLDITFAGGKFCAPIANTNKFVVIG